MYNFLLVRHCKYSFIIIPFLSCLTLNNIVTLKSGLEVTQGHSNWHHSKAWCNFLFAFHSNYGSILHYFRDKAWYWSKIVIYWYPLVFDAPVRGVPSEYCYAVWHGKKLEWRGYPKVKKIDDMFICFDTAHERDRQTPHDDISCACIASRGKNHAAGAIKAIVHTVNMKFKEE